MHFAVESVITVGSSTPSNDALIVTNMSLCYAVVTNNFCVVFQLL